MLRYETRWTGTTIVNTTVNERQQLCEIQLKFVICRSLTANEFKGFIGVLTSLKTKGLHKAKAELRILDLAGRSDFYAKPTSAPPEPRP